MEKQVKEGKNFSAVDLGSFAGLKTYVFPHPSQPIKLKGKIFLKDLLQLTGAEISLNRLGPGKSIPFYHKHRLNEEIYLFVRGKGEFQIDDIVLPIEEGTALRVAPQGERCLRSHPQEELCYIVVQVRENSYQGSTIEDGLAVDKVVSWEGSS